MLIRLLCVNWCDREWMTDRHQDKNLRRHKPNVSTSVRDRFFDSLRFCVCLFCSCVFVSLWFYVCVCVGSPSSHLAHPCFLRVPVDDLHVWSFCGCFVSLCGRFVSFLWSFCICLWLLIIFVCCRFGMFCLWSCFEVFYCVLL